ncbi:cellulase family glycosylhydrolase [Candidatus Nomurabacteria bacterium]|nr:cellulase family glycosylhydrolase [Candidatus Nomurabacteria bacterium]
MKKQSGLRGVNLGGWLVLEKWMTPQVFDGFNARNEWELTQSKRGRDSIKKHQKMFIYESDFKWLRDNEVELIRIPFGYWVFGDEPPYVKCVDRLDWAVKMAKKYNLRVLLDMHAAVGAQNRADHSGSGSSSITISWLGNRDNQNKTISVLERIADRYKNEPHIWGIQLLNEPDSDKYGFRLISFYRRAYRRVIKKARPGTRIVFSDAFMPWLLTGALWKRSHYPVIMDVHIYFCFGVRKHLHYKQQIARLNKWRLRLRFFSFFQPVMIGEWSGVLHKEGFEKQHEFAKIQQNMFDKLGYTHCYWSYKTSSTSGWNYRKLVEKGFND